MVAPSPERTAPRAGVKEPPGLPSWRMRRQGGCGLGSCGSPWARLLGAGLLLRPMLLTQLSLLLLLLLLGGSARAARGHERGQGPQQPFEMLYNRGVEAFSAGDFQAAVRYLEQALSSRRRLREERLRCRLECGARAPLRTARGGGPAWELRFLRALLERARCVRRCERADEDSGCGEHCAAASARVLSRSPEDVSLDFQKRMPYSYLQQAYSQQLLCGEGAMLRLSAAQLFPSCWSRGLKNLLQMLPYFTASPLKCELWKLRAPLELPALLRI